MTLSLRTLFLPSLLAAVALGCDREEDEVVIEEVVPEPRRSGGSEAVSGEGEAQPGARGSDGEGASGFVGDTSGTESGGTSPASAAPTGPTAVNPALLDPASLDEQAPDQYTVRLNTTEGPVHIEVHRAWAPRGADRFYNLVTNDYFADTAFFRVVEGFMAQVGLHGSPEVNRAWRDAKIDDDPVEQTNTRGMVSFATSGPDSRVNQFFINFGDNTRLDPMGFAPFGKVREGDMAVVDRLYSGYGEGAPRGRGPMQGLIQARGNEYLRAEFPELDYIESAEIVEP